MGGGMEVGIFMLVFDAITALCLVALIVSTVFLHKA